MNWNSLNSVSCVSAPICAPASVFSHSANPFPSHSRKHGCNISQFHILLPQAPETAFVTLFLALSFQILLRDSSTSVRGTPLLYSRLEDPMDRDKATQMCYERREATSG